VSRKGDPGAGPQGLAVVDKPAGWTSHDVVARSRKLLGTRRVGHAGTLDPDATGVLLLGVGRVTRLLRFITALSKTYTTDIIFGTETDTLDASGTVTATHDMSSITDEQVRSAVVGLTGDIQQIPPMVSAVRVDGQRLHVLARAGIEVERQPRPVTVHGFGIEPIPGSGSPPMRWRATVECSSGTYVRVLAADLGAALGGGAHLEVLRRTAIGPFSESEAVPLDDLTPESLLAPVDALRWMPMATVDATVAADVAHGKVLPVEVISPLGHGLISGDLPPAWRVVGPDGDLLAVYEPHSAGRAKPAVVLAAAG
jgi:tRNA pseudouridine55 synthase